MPERPSPRTAALVTAVVLTSVLALVVYRSTMLPGFDFGDTAGFQDTGGESEVTPRQAYPLYYAVGWLVVHAAGEDPAYGMNLSSVLCAAIACGLIAWLGAVLSGSVGAGLFAALLFGSSYTFWSQAIIAEVYALHVLMLAASLLALTWWGRAPASLGRLAVFFALYALGFGNHLMMILLAPAATVYIAVRIPGGLKGLVAPRVVLLALAIAAAGALQYAWNFSYLYTLPEAPASLREACHTFWFDVTKSDWRSTMIVGIDPSAYRLRMGMYWFDLTQQFGVAPVVLAVAGIAWLAASRWREACLVLVGYLVAAGFAYTYNVGDAHVFFLPSHLFVALAAGCGLAGVGRLASRVPAAPRVAGATVILLALALPAWRAYDTWPAVDRSDDRRPLDVVRQITRALDPRERILVADLNWQIQNGLDYYTHHLRQEIIQVRGGDRILTLPWLVRDNLAIGREVVVLPQTRALFDAAYAGVLPMEREDSAPSLDREVATLPAGTPYALALQQPYPDVPYDRDELLRTVQALTGGTATIDPGGVYTIMAGLTGARPTVRHEASRPYRLRTSLAGLDLDVRMESWLPADTMRRAGFGHVIANRRHALILERGVSFVAFGAGGAPRMRAYASGLLAPLPRFHIRPQPGA
jgi:hypothetical protein